MGRKSIKQRLQSARSDESKHAVAIDWAHIWQRDHDDTMRALERAIRHDDFDQLCRATGQLKALHEKRFVALPNVLEALLYNHEGD